MSAIPDGSALPSFPPSLLAGLQAAVSGSGGVGNVSNGGDAPLLVLEPKNITESASDEHPGLVPLVPGTEAPLRNEAIFAFDLNQLPVKPWHEGTDPEQFFNYGFNEDTWKEHCLSTPVGEAAQLKREEKAKERDMSKMRAAAAPAPAPMPLGGMFAPSGSAPAVNVELLKQVVSSLPGAAGGGGGGPPGGLPPPPIAPLGAPGGMHGTGGGGGGGGGGSGGGYQPYPSPYNKGGSKGGKGGGFGRKGDKGSGGFKGAGSKGGGGGGGPEPSGGGGGGDGAMPPLGGGPVPLLNPALLAALSSNPALKALMGKQGAGQGGQQQQGPVAD